MIIGLTILANLFHIQVQNVFLWIIIHINYKKDKSIHSLIKKNMIAHHERNNKTSLMFTITLCFLIFVGAGC